MRPAIVCVSHPIVSVPPSHHLLSMLRPSPWHLLVLVVFIAPAAWSSQHQHQSNVSSSPPNTSASSGSACKLMGACKYFIAAFAVLAIAGIAHKVIDHGDTLDEKTTPRTQIIADEGFAVHLLFYIVVAAVVFAIGGVLFYCCYRKKKKKHSTDSKSNQLDKATSATSQAPTSAAGSTLLSTAGSSLVNSPKVQSTVLLPTSQLGLPKQLSQGTKSTVGSQISAQSSAARSSFVGSVLSSNASAAPSEATSKLGGGTSSAALSGVSNFSQASSTPLSSTFSMGSTSAISTAGSKAATSKAVSGTSNVSQLSYYSKASNVSQLNSNLNSKVPPSHR